MDFFFSKKNRASSFFEGCKSETSRVGRTCTNSSVLFCNTRLVDSCTSLRVKRHPSPSYSYPHHRHSPCGGGVTDVRPEAYTTLSGQVRGYNCTVYPIQNIDIRTGTCDYVRIGYARSRSPEHQATRIRHIPVAASSHLLRRLGLPWRHPGPAGGRVGPWERGRRGCARRGGAGPLGTVAAYRLGACPRRRTARVVSVVPLALAIPHFNGWPCQWTCAREERARQRRGVDPRMDLHARPPAGRPAGRRHVPTCMYGARSGRPRTCVFPSIDIFLELRSRDGRPDAAGVVDQLRQMGKKGRERPVPGTDARIRGWWQAFRSVSGFFSSVRWLAGCGEQAGGREGSKSGRQQ
jgi:hypothetical protein